MTPTRAGVFFDRRHDPHLTPPPGGSFIWNERGGKVRSIIVAFLAPASVGAFFLFGTAYSYRDANLDRAFRRLDHMKVSVK